MFPQVTGKFETAPLLFLSKTPYITHANDVCRHTKYHGQFVKKGSNASRHSIFSKVALVAAGAVGKAFSFALGYDLLALQHREVLSPQCPVDHPSDVIVRPNSVRSIAVEQVEVAE